jgi:hypothetical protein
MNLHLIIPINAHHINKEEGGSLIKMFWLTKT